MDKLIKELHSDCKCGDPYFARLPLHENGKDAFTPCGALLRLYEDELQIQTYSGPPTTLGGSDFSLYAYRITNPYSISTNIYLILNTLEDIDNISSISFVANGSILYYIDLQYIIACEKEKVIQTENQVKILIFDYYFFMDCLVYCHLRIDIVKKKETKISLIREGVMLCNNIRKKLMSSYWSIPITIGSRVIANFINANKLILLDYHKVKSLTITDSNSNDYKYDLLDYNPIIKEVIPIEGLCDIISEYIKDRIDIALSEISQRDIIPLGNFATNIVENLLINDNPSLRGTLTIKGKLHLKKFYQTITRHLIVVDGTCYMKEDIIIIK